MLLWLSLISTLLILPFILAYLGGSFWLKESFYWEQPQVVYAQQLLLLVQGISASTAAPITVMYSTNALFNQFMDPFVRMAAIKSWMVDFDADGVNDQILFNISVPVGADEQVNHVRLAIGLQYQLSSQIRFYTQSMFFIDTASPLTGNSLYVDGDLQLIQRWPMQDKVDYMFTNPAINFTQAVGNDYAALTWPRIVSDYLDKDVRTTLVSPMPIWSTPRGSNDPFTITIKVRIPKDRIVYRPALLQVLKNGWIQYIACWVIVAAVLIPLYKYVLQHQIVATYVSIQTSVDRDAKHPAGFKRPLF
ncbi:hypothetical protein BDV3_004214 [Batrachochytrium dendrobatidis]